MQAHGASDYLLMGHVTADLMPDGRVLGGTVSFAAPIAHGLGHRVKIMTSTAACEPLLEYLQPFADIAVRIAPQTTTFANIYHDGKRHQTIHAVAASLTYDWIPQGWVKSPLIHLAPLVQDIDPHIVYHWHDATLLLTPQGLLRRWGNDGIVHFKRWFDPDILQRIDIVIMSRQDIAAAPELEFLYARHCRCLVITNGAAGGTYYLDGNPYHFPAYTIKERNPTGAGDAFATAILAGLPYLNNDIHRTIHFAAHIAALTVARESKHNMLTASHIKAVLAQYQS